MMLRRSLVLLAFAVTPAALFTLTNGCGDSEPDVENLCGFLGDQGNCEQTFITEVGDRCGAVGKGNGPHGQFGSRAMLDVCILDEGGIVAFDPPPDATMFP